MLTKKQFDILVRMAEKGEPETQRSIAGGTGMSLGVVNKMVPITLNTPKPLVRVHGKRIIDSLLDAVYAAGIEEVYIIRGYLSEQFDQLLYKYPNIKFIENPVYNEANNISSAMCARYLLQNAYLCEADLLLYNPALICKYQYCSNYLGVPVDVTDDWCFKTKNGIITKLCVGGTIICSEFRIGTRRTERALRDISSRSTIPPEEKSVIGIRSRLNIISTNTRSPCASAPLTTSRRSTLTAS